MPTLLVGTVLAGISAPALGQQQAAPAPVAAPAPAPAPQPGSGTIRSVNVVGSQRLEPDTVRSYVQLRPGEPYTRESLDQALKDLFATELFADAEIRDNQGALTIVIKENPVINRIVLEGNKRLKEDKIRPEIRLAPRQIFTRSKVRADIARIIELYRRQGRFAASIEPKMVMLDQNRVDIIFEISEGAKSKVRQINIIGNEKFSDSALRSEMATKQSRFFRFFSSSDSYDPDRLSYDQSKLRQFYLTQGYADFRVISAIAELTPDRRDFIITYVVEEGDRYKFGDVKVESDLRDFKPEGIKRLLPMKKGDWYDAKQVEDTVNSITETAGLFGYAFAEVNPNFERDKDSLTMGLTFRVEEAPRVYIERIDINGNTTTQDKVVRREFRLQEGDAFNSFMVKRSQDRINSLGYFQEKLEVEQKPGSAPDRIVLETNVEEKSTGELQLSAGFSSLERFIVNASITQRNFRGKGQTLRASVNYSSYSKSVELGFTEPYLFDRNIAIGGDVFRRDLNSFNFNLSGDRNTTYEQTTTGFQIRLGVPLTEYVQLQGRYGLSTDKVSLDRQTFFFNGECDPLLAGRYLCDAIGNRTTSSLGYSLVFSNLNNSIRPTAGQRAVFSQDFAGLGGSVKYLRSRLEAKKFWGVGGGFVFSVGAEGGYVLPFGSGEGPGIDKVRLTDRFFLGEPQIRGFDIRGVGPRVQRIPYTTDSDGNQVLVTDRRQIFDDALGGRAYYMARAELEIPLGSGAREMGLRPSIFVDAGAVFGVKRPKATATFETDEDGVLLPIIRPIKDADGNPLFVVPVGDDAANPNPNAGSVTTCSTGFGEGCVGTIVNVAQVNTISPFKEEFLGNSAKPRISVGFGVNWNSPFGPLRIDIAKALLKERGDDTKLFTFNVGTQF
ncbi:MAG: outer membrane protein assembly factor BamA [Sphingomonas sp. SCN 67-18]|uniref:outer membrane protein assembly factor BamA n=1 Tax=uncultured Sphingomonas sp. TaxID=158754 RepID=UPI000868D064|nr:outer membrane protein assembly factor BamA [Sphingomonas sp. SCN 67-18]ODU20912.1 MAG: outer membrane protein assembly factor BamA [Sphingomonas sp. SCN 67-18]